MDDVEEQAQTRLDVSGDAVMASACEDVPFLEQSCQQRAQACLSKLRCPAPESRARISAQVRVPCSIPSILLYSILEEQAQTRLNVSRDAVMASVCEDVAFLQQSCQQRSQACLSKLRCPTPESRARISAQVPYVTLE
jgi:uncharacterized FlgJ-related protein